MSQISENSNISAIHEIQEFNTSTVSFDELSDAKSVRFTLDDMHSFCPDNILAALDATRSDFIATNCKINAAAHKTVDCSTSSKTVLGKSKEQPSLNKMEVKYRSAFDVKKESFTLDSVKNRLNINTTSKIVCSPTTLRTVFSDTFAPTIKKMEINGLNSLDAKKAAIMHTIGKMDIKISNPQAVTNGMKALISANNEVAFNTQLKAVMNDLETAHTKAFSVSLANVCAIASFNVGFKQIKIKPVLNGKIAVFAINNDGKKLISEISIDIKTKQVNCNTETADITDGSCTTIIKQFNEELKKMGVKIGSNKTTYTGGECRLPYSKIIDATEKEKQNKKKIELDRAKKLNNNFNNKIKN